MRRFVLCLAALAVVMTPAAASDKKKAVKEPVYTKDHPMSQNEASWRLLKESLPLFLPTVVSVAYLSTHKDADQKGTKAKKAK